MKSPIQSIGSWSHVQGRRDAMYMVSPCIIQQCEAGGVPNVKELLRDCPRLGKKSIGSWSHVQGRRDAMYMVSPCIIQQCEAGGVPNVKELLRDCPRLGKTKSR